jgi:hypothetical protein
MKKISVLAIFLILSFGAFAQLSLPGKPISFGLEIDNKSIPVEIMPAFDVEQMLKEDAEREKIGPFRFGFNHDVYITPQHNGIWVERKDGNLWLMRIKSPQAYSINLQFNDFKLPEGSSLFIYNAEKTHVLGKFGAHNNHDSRLFATDLIQGEEIILEYFAPKNISELPQMIISTVTHAYINTFTREFAKNFGSSGACNMNVNCPAGLAWDDQKRATVMLVSGGNGFCTGALVNNSNNDGTPYILTANHCGSSGFGNWVFRFNWEAAACNNPATSPTFQSLNGSTSRANNAGSDFRLVQINNPVPASYNAYFAGWNNANTPSTSSVGIHHPSGDIKKIAIDNDAPTSQTFSGADCWRVINWELNTTTEQGSSGSPLFDQNGRITGQLYGGGAACGNTESDYYGKLSTSWNGSAANNRLRDWLNPANNLITLNGYDPNITNVNLDAGILQILEPNFATSCNTSISPVVVLRNFGANTLTKVTIISRINNNVVNTYIWTGSLATGNITQINLPSFNAVSGANTLEIRSTLPNDLSDQNTANDAKSVNFDIISANGVAAPVTEGFQGNFVPTNWSIDNPDNLNTWAKNSDYGGFGTSTASAWMDNFNYNAAGQRDFLISPYINFSNVSGNEAQMAFSVAYARYGTGIFASHDSLIVSVSGDCGQTWMRKYVKGNTELSTRPGVTSAFYPLSSEWRREIINLSEFSGNANVQVRFEAFCGYGNNLFIDDIMIGSSLVSSNAVELSNQIQLYPNPASNEVNITFKGSLDNDRITLKIFDFTGKEVINNDNITKEQGRIFINTENLSNGFYMLEFNTHLGRISKKLMINK